MRRIEEFAYARAGLVGNPSDGYFGKTLSCSLRNFFARVVIYEWPTLEILPSEQDHVRFNSLAELAEDVRLNGYYGGLRLVKASLKKFHDYCTLQNLSLPAQNFTIRYETTVPRQVGLAGSSAIITATFRALMQFYQFDIPQPILPNWVLATENEELGIAAGLQDRVCQTYEGLVYMDFNRETMEKQGYGHYESLDPSLLPPLYLAYQTRLAEVSGAIHSDLRRRWEQRNPEVVQAMKQFAELTEQAKEALLQGQPEELGEIMDANFDLRRKIVPIREDYVKMIQTARSCGASAKFTGSGGAIIGTYPHEEAYSRLEEELLKIGCRVVRAQVK